MGCSCQKCRANKPREIACCVIELQYQCRMSGFGDEAEILGSTRAVPVLTDTVEKGFWGRSLSNIDSRSNATAQSRFKNPFVRIRLFQILIPQLHFIYFFNSINPKVT